MVEVKNNSDIELYHYYFIKDSILYKSKNLENVIVGDDYCHIFTSPSTPPNIVLVVEKKTNEMLKWFNVHLREVVNADYFNINGVKNFLLNNGTFKNYWE